MVEWEYKRYIISNYGDGREREKEMLRKKNVRVWESRSEGKGNIFDLWSVANCEREVFKRLIPS